MMQQWNNDKWCKTIMKSGGSEQVTGFKNGNQIDHSISWAASLMQPDHGQLVHHITYQAKSLLKAILMKLYFEKDTYYPSDSFSSLAESMHTSEGNCWNVHLPSQSGFSVSINFCRNVPSTFNVTIKST